MAVALPGDYFSLVQGEEQWRHIWEIEHDAPVAEELPSSPPVVDPIEGLPEARLLSIMQAGAGWLRLEIITPHRWLNGPEVGYIIRLLWMLENLLDHLRIDGHPRPGAPAGVIASRGEGQGPTTGAV